MMTEVLQKIRQLHDLLEEKITANDKKTLELREEKAKQDERERKQNATAIHLAAKERIVKKVGDLVEAQEEVELGRKEVASEKARLADRIAENIKLKATLEKEIEETKKAQALFIKKRDAIEVEKAEIAKREKIKQDILNELRKGI